MFRSSFKFASRFYSTKGAFDVVIVGGGPGGYVASIAAVCINHRRWRKYLKFEEFY